MDLSQAIKIVEGDIDSTEREQIEAWQWLIDKGHVWNLQGWYGRNAVELIEAEICSAPS
jgi:hypothetical protein